MQLMGSHDRIPVETYDMHISSTPTRDGRRARRIIMDETMRSRPTACTEDVEKTREFWPRTETPSNRTPVDELPDQYYFDGLDYISNYEKVLASITNEDIQQLAEILDDGNLVHVVMRPATAETPAE
ncbi:MAG: hypothetical protein ACLS37_12690 [Alistipes sp.]